jgi:hypothetical protein
MSSIRPAEAMSPADAQAVARTWESADTRAAVLPADREIISSSASIRGLIVELAMADNPGDELFDACAVLGRLIGGHHGSPTLAASTIDHACTAIGAIDPPWLAPARAATIEGFARALLDREHTQARQAWEYPRCGVPIGGARLAIAASYPSDDPEMLDDWAARVARSAALDGYRSAFVEGPAAARRALVDALRLVGIGIRSSDERDPF